jgi:MFS family permease
MSASERMSAREIGAAVGLAAIFGLRMLGLFVILPVFALYAKNLGGGSNLTLVGIALGAYGLTQALLQIPFGRWSDRVGRKPALYVGLLIFAAGSALAGYATTIQGVILGRALQGAGAISAVAIAMAADLTRDEHRTKVMAIIGSTIGVSFAASLIVGPWLDRVIGVSGIFYLIGVLALVAVAVVAALPVPSEEGAVAGRQPVSFGEVLRDAELNRLNVGIFVLHAVLMSLFITVPFDLTAAGLVSASHWMVYAAVMAGSVLFMLPCVHFGDRRGHARPVFLLCIALVLASQAMLVPHGLGVTGVGAALLVFFMGFMVLEAALPAHVSRAAPAGSRGTAVAVYSTVQFLGAAFGSALGGYLMQNAGRVGLLSVNAALIAFWMACAWGMRSPGVLSARSYPVPPMDSSRAQELSMRLRGLAGVREARVHGSAGVAYLKVDARAFDERDVLQLIAGES